MTHAVVGTGWSFALGSEDCQVVVLLCCKRGLNSCDILSVEDDGARYEE